MFDILVGGHAWDVFWPIYIWWQRGVGTFPYYFVAGFPHVCNSNKSILNKLISIAAIGDCVLFAADSVTSAGRGHGSNIL